MVLDSVLQLSKKLRYKLFEAPKGYGSPIATEIFEEQYKDGFWEFLDSIDELANYMVTAGYMQHFAKNLDEPPSLLDIGCGHGNLAELLSGYQYESYLGLDISAEAVWQASRRKIKNAEFQVADVEQWTTEQKFDFILSSGSICYFKDPTAFLKRSAKFLKEDGMFIISLWRFGHNGIIWKNLEKYFVVVDSTIVTNKKGMAWDVKVLR